MKRSFFYILLCLLLTTCTTEELLERTDISIALVNETWRVHCVSPGVLIPVRMDVTNLATGQEVSRDLVDMNTTPQYIGMFVREGDLISTVVYQLGLGGDPVFIANGNIEVLIENRFPGNSGLQRQINYCEGNGPIYFSW